MIKYLRNNGSYVDKFSDLTKTSQDNSMLKSLNNTSVKEKKIYM